VVPSCRTIFFAMAITCAIASPARADGLEVYAPRQQNPTYALEVHGGVLFPLETTQVCPPGGDCVVGAGFGLGTLLVRQEPDGVGLLLGYEVWLLDGNTVYEVTALHSIRFGLRWVLDTSSRVQPLLLATVAALLLTDPAEARSAGAMVTVGAGMEIELTADVSVSLAAELGLSSLAAFRTPDGVDRARDFGVNVTLQTTAGLIILLGDSSAR
jgi:hypothetical protein